MGYTTDFTGQLDITPALNAEQVKYINDFCSTRRMGRNVEILQDTYKGKYSFNGNYGNEGEYFVKPNADFGQQECKSIIDYNVPPGQMPYEAKTDYYEENQRRIAAIECVPGLWCQWTISEDGKILEWDGGEKFYNYTEWLQYLINHFFNVWNVKLNGEIEWKGEDSTDLGQICVIDSIITIKIGRIIYE